MRITSTVPDEVGKEVKRRTDNVSAYVSEVLAGRLQEEKRRQARLELLDMAGKGRVDPGIHEINQRCRHRPGRDPAQPCVTQP